MELWGGDLAGKHLTVDGKVSRGAKETTTGKSTLHILRAWVSEASLSVGHEVCAEKSDQLEALPRLLAKLQLHGAIVTIDAMGGHPDIAHLIQDTGADYILALKANEKEAHHAFVAHFESLRPTPESAAAGEHGWAEGCEESSTSEQNRGRYEQREVIVQRDMGWWPKSWRWDGLQSIICVWRETMRQQRTAESPSIETHYHLSSSKAEAAELLLLIRNPWSVENQCHHLLNVTYHEDHCQVCDIAAAHNLTLMREPSTKVLKSSPVKGSITGSASAAASTPPSGPKPPNTFSMVLMREACQRSCFCDFLC